VCLHKIETADILKIERRLFHNPYNRYYKLDRRDHYEYQAECIFVSSYLNRIVKKGKLTNKKVESLLEIWFKTDIIF